MNAYREPGEVPKDDRKGKPFCGGTLMPAPAKPHECSPPGWWARQFSCLSAKQIWQCGCGEFHMWSGMRWMSESREPSYVREALIDQGYRRR